VKLQYADLKHSLFGQANFQLHDNFLKHLLTQLGFKDVFVNDKLLVFYFGVAFWQVAEEQEL
jgi:hypothetical protein